MVEPPRPCYRIEHRRPGLTREVVAVADDVAGAVRAVREHRRRLRDAGEYGDLVVIDQLGDDLLGNHDRTVFLQRIAPHKPVRRAWWAF